MPSTKKAAHKSTTKRSFAYRLVQIDGETRITAVTVDGNDKFVALENEDACPAELVGYGRDGLKKDIAMMLAAFDYPSIDLGQPALLG